MTSLGSICTMLSSSFDGLKQFCGTLDGRVRLGKMQRLSLVIKLYSLTTRVDSPITGFVTFLLVERIFPSLSSFTSL